MLIETTRFGGVEIDESRVITFSDGLLGFPGLHKFALIQPSPDAAFYWLQSIDDPALAFVVCDPADFVADYHVPMRAEEARTLGIDDAADSQVLVIVNKADGCLTGNLQGPLVIGVKSLLGRQLVLSEKRYTTRQRLMKTAAPQAVRRPARKVG